MAYHDFWTQQVYFERLKNLRNCTIKFEKHLVGILGVNGCGKSTVLHALACMYKPKPGMPNYKFSMFFTPNTFCRWNDSKIILSDTYKENGVQLTRNETFEKQSRWTPRYERRLERYVVYIGIKSCVPMIEIESQKGNIRLRTTPLTDADSIRVKTLTSYILDKRYDEYNLNQANHRKYIGVRNNNISYCALSMGAGEQRVFTIVEQLIKAPNSSLILIDEIDLLLHKNALIRLLQEANKLAETKNLQIIFTTHNHSILKLEFIQFQHLFQTNDRTLCLENANPNVMFHLTGEQERPISVYVEDDLAKALIKQVAAQLQIKKMVNVETYGAASNCFTCASGITLMNLNRNGTFFVLDGDCYRTEDEKREQLKKYFTGNTPDIARKRDATLQFIYQFTLPEHIKPEKYYHQCIISIPDERLNSEELEYKTAANDIMVVNDDHRYLSDIIRRIGESRETGLKIIAQILTKSDEWEHIVYTIKATLNAKKLELNL